jgi:AcrR family transcriptional regulator
MPAPRRPRDAARTRSRVIDAAAKEFSLRGYDGATLTGIARRAKVSKQLIHHHFRSKEALFREVHDIKFRPTHHWRDTLPDDPRDLLAARFEKRKRDLDYARFLAWEAASARHRSIPGAEERRARVAEYGQAIRDMQQAGKLPPELDWRLIQLATLSLATYPMAFTQITRFVTGKDATDPEFQTAWTAFLRQVGARLFG